MSVSLDLSLPGVGWPRRHTGSVLPVVDGQRVRDGWRMQIKAERGTHAIGTAAGILFGIVPAAFIIAWIANDFRLFGCGGVMIAFVVFSTAAGMVTEFRHWLVDLWKMRRFGGAELLVRPWPLRLGDEVKLQFFQPKRRQTAIERVEAFIECLELYVEEADDSRWWSTRSRRRIELDDGPLPEAHRPFRFTWAAQIPTNEPGSCFFTESAVEWRFTVRLHGEQEQVVESVFTLLVLPEVRL